MLPPLGPTGPRSPLGGIGPLSGMGALSLLFGMLRSLDDLGFSSIFGLLGGLAVFLGS